MRELGKNLGLRYDIVQRHPFPGPGLAIRIICATEAFIDADFEATAGKAQAIVNEVDGNCKVTILPIKSVGVQGDCRSYSYVAALSTDENPIPWAVLDKIAKKLPNRLHNINRFLTWFLYNSLIGSFSEWCMLLVHLSVTLCWM